MSASAAGNGPVIGFYGDDFTGSTDALEILALAGLDPVLITDLDRAGDVPDLACSRAVGIAGLSRSKSPEWMREHLPRHLRFLQALGVRICHYKVCSTFDSAPRIGSIGSALEIGRAIYGGRTVPIIVGAPDLGRYQVFGNLFARAGGEIFRIDRHPTMKAHPVTPMAEADLRLHLAAQTDLPLGLLDIVELSSDQATKRFAAKMGESLGALFLDVADDETSARAGELIWQALPHPAFVVGSSGVEYALLLHWRRTGTLPGASALPQATAAEQIVVVSGSCSPATAAQIARAEEDGFASFRLAAEDVLGPERPDRLDRLASEVAAAHARGRSTVIYTARGPQDPALASFAAALRSRGLSAEAGNEALGTALGELLRRVLPRIGVRRVVVAGGDTSGRIVGQLGVTSLRIRAPLVRGAPLCVATAANPEGHGLELVLKGGQVGEAGFFSAARAGASAASPAPSDIGMRQRKEAS